MAVASVALALAGCANLFGPPRTPVDLVSERAKARWEALVAQDWEKAYSFATPGYRSAIDVNGFKARHSGGAVVWKGVESVATQCEEQVCEARVVIQFEPVVQKGFGQLKTTVIEKWLLEEGKWWVQLTP